MYFLSRLMETGLVNSKTYDKSLGRKGKKMW